MISILTQIKSNIQGHNKFATDDYLDTLSVISKLRLTHPLDRKILATRALEESLITKEERDRVGTGKGWG